MRRRIIRRNLGSIARQEMTGHWHRGRWPADAMSSRSSAFARRIQPEWRSMPLHAPESRRQQPPPQAVSVMIADDIDGQRQGAPATSGAGDNKMIFAVGFAR